MCVLIYFMNDICNEFSVIVSVCVYVFIGSSAYSLYDVTVVSLNLSHLLAKGITAKSAISHLKRESIHAHTHTGTSPKCESVLSMCAISFRFSSASSSLPFRFCHFLENTHEHTHKNRNECIIIDLLFQSKWILY